MERRLPTVATVREWLRKRTGLMTAYRMLPETWRQSISHAYVRRMMRDVQFSSLPSMQRQAGDGPAPVQAEADEAGINLFAYFRGRFGLAEAARLYARALIEFGYPVALNDIELELPHDFNEKSLDHRLVAEAPFDAGIVFVNPDYLQAALERIGSDRMRGRPLIACWFWELEDVPDTWRAAISGVEGIIVASAFVEQAFRRVTGKPICRVPLPLFDEEDSGLGRWAFGLDTDDYVFLTSFDFHSWVERKNPFAVVEAFKSAFPVGNERARLVIKTSNGAQYPDVLATLLRATQGERRIMVRDDILDRAHLRALQRCCDVYVSLHRAEGFGLGLAECMRQGKPVIATGWSGNMEFMDAENSCLVGYRLVAVPSGGYLHADGQRWADPDVPEAAAWMKRLFDDRTLGPRIGEKARLKVRRDLDPALASSRIRSFVDGVRAASATAACAPAVDGGAR